MRLVVNTFNRPRLDPRSRLTRLDTAQLRNPQYKREFADAVVARATAAAAASPPSCGHTQIDPLRPSLTTSRDDEATAAAARLEVDQSGHVQEHLSGEAAEPGMAAVSALLQLCTLASVTRGASEVVFQGHTRFKSCNYQRA